MNSNPELDHAVEKRNERYYSFCDKLIALSTGALTLSVTFKTTLVPEFPRFLWLLGLSWASFTTTILAALLVHWGEAWIWNRRANEVLNEESSDGQLPKRFSVARWFMFAAFILAVLTFVAFALFNIEQQAPD